MSTVKLVEPVLAKRSHGGKVKSLISKALVVILAAGTLVALPAASAAIRVPKTTWPVCKTNSNEMYCVESVSVTTARGRTIPLTWVPDGVARPTNTNPWDTYIMAASVDIQGDVVQEISFMAKPDFERVSKTKWVNITNLINTPSFPKTGALYSSGSQNFDLTEPIAFWSEKLDFWGWKDGVETITSSSTWGAYIKSAVAELDGNKVINIHKFNVASMADKWLAINANRYWVDATSLVQGNLQPVLGSLYDKSSKSFTKTEPIVIPNFMSEVLLINGGTIIGLSGTDSETSTIKSPLVTAGRSLSGRWTHPSWNALGLGSLGYGGLFVDAKTANEFVNHLFVDVQPTLADESNHITLAAQFSNNKYAANLDTDITVSVRLRTGEIKAGVTVGVGTDVTADFQSGGNYSRLTVTGNPVTVPLAAKSSDCSGETGIAKANVRQLQAILFLNNDGQSAFGAEGTSGDMVVASNGVCDLSTPVWNSETKEFSWTAAAPHFAADGVTQNMGFYKAIIPAADAKILWGLENPNDAVKALSIQVSTTENGSSAALSTIGVKNGKIYIDVSGFGYSRPKLKIALKKGWKPKTTMLNKTTITCTLGKTVKKITAVKPTCPKGYKKKN